MNILPDIILIALIIIAFAAGHKKGLVKSVQKIAALVITIILVTALKNPAVEFVYKTPFAENVYTKVTQTVHIPQGGGVNVAESLHLPDFMHSTLEAGETGAANAVNTINDAAAVSVTGIIITIATCLALFIIIRLVLMAVFMILNGVSKAPVIKGANKLAGGLLAAVNMIFIVFLALALFTMFAPADSGLYEMINHSYIVKYLYNYNILLQLFMRA